MKSANRLVQDGTISQAYADAEGITLIPEFKAELYCRPYVRKHWDPLFPDKGVTISSDLGLRDEKLSLKEWFPIAEEAAVLDYIHCRVYTADEEFCDREEKLFMGVLHMDPAHVAKAFKRLNGESAPGELYSRQSLLMIGACMWSTHFVPRRFDRDREAYGWRNFVAQKNTAAKCRRDYESRRQANVAEFLGAEG